MTEGISLRLSFCLAAGDRTKAQVTPENPENETLSVKPNYELILEPFARYDIPQELVCSALLTWY